MIKTVPAVPLGDIPTLAALHGALVTNRRTGCALALAHDGQNMPCIRR